MKKNRYLFFALLSVITKLYGSDLPIITIPPESIEKTAYEDILRVVDEVNRKNGKRTKYLEGSTHDLSPKDNGIDIVAIAHLGETSELTSIKGQYHNESYHPAIDIFNKKLDSIDKNLKEKLPFIGNSINKRFYFGNGNIVNDIVFKKGDHYNNTIEKLMKNEKYSINGIYKNLNKILNKNYDTPNPLNISMKDYKEKIQGKSKKEIAKYLQMKLKEYGIETELKNDDLFTKDGKNEWKVLWDLQGVRIREGYDLILTDTVYSKIYIYEPKNENGKSFYTKDSNIYVEDMGISKDKLRIIGGSYYNREGKTLEELLEEKSEESSNYSNAFEKLVSDKQKVQNGKMSEKEFNDKWVTPFVKGGEYEKSLEKYLKKVTPFQKNMEFYDSESKKLAENLKEIENNSKLPEDYYKVWNWGEKNKDYIDSLSTQEEKDLVEKYFDLRKKKDEYSDKYFKEYEKIQEIQKAYGFYTGFAGWAENDKEAKEAKWRKWTDRIISDKNLVLEKEAKIIEFRGKGRVNGTIDLGSGYNKLIITEQFTGKYGTNIILGPYAKLKNINIVEVGRAVGDKDNPSLSGNHSLTFDIDPNIKNNKGYLIQHAFKDSDKNIEFTNANTLTVDEKNSFAIEMMVSKLNENSIIDMGRPLETEVRNIIDGNKGLLKSKITLDSDSIAHEIVDLNRLDSNGNSLVEVKIKDRIDGLDEIENKVYKSIKDAKKLGYLWETTTSTNKKTVFGGIREQESTNELKMLTDQIAKKNIYKHLNRISKNELNVYTSLPFSLYNKGESITGGYISNRDVEKKFKGNTNTGYALYEKILNPNLKIGGIFGGASSSYKEIKKDSLDTVTTDSSIKGNSIYLGTYANYSYTPNLSLISGLGVQYGEYKVNRKLKNNYQNLSFESKPKTHSLSFYNGFKYNYSLNKDMNINFKGILSYSLIIQNEIEESKNNLSLKIDKQNFNYLDSELGVNITKSLYGENGVSKLSAGISGLYGLIGYDNKNMSGRIKDSTSTFSILGKNNKKDSIKLSLNYDVLKNSGMSYGIEGDYLTNSQRKNITIGVKIGYTF